MASDPVSRIKESTRVAERALVGSASEAIFSMLVAKFPFIAWPMIKTIAQYLLDKFLFWLSEEGIIWFNTAWVRVRVSADASSLEKARQKAILAMDGTSMDKELDNIDKELRDAFDRLHRGSRNPL